MKEPLWAIGLGIVVLFTWGMGMAVYCQFLTPGAPRPDAMPGYLGALVSGLNGGLALNLGALLGIRGAFGPRLGPRLAKESIQLTLAVYYGIMWCLATVCWRVAELAGNADSVVGILPETSSSGIKICVAVLFVLLGLEAAYKRAVGSHRQGGARLG